AGPVLAHAPTLVARPAFLPRRSQHLLGHAASDVLGGEKDAKRFSDDLLGTITLDALGLRTPGGDAAFGVQHVDRVSLRALRQRAEAFLDLPKRRSCLPALGDTRCEQRHDLPKPLP